MPNELPGGIAFYIVGMALLGLAIVLIFKGSDDGD